MSGSEIITMLMHYHLDTFKNFKHFYLHCIGVRLRGEFPRQLSCSRFIAVEHKVFAPMMLFLNIACFGKCTGISFVDSTRISVCHNKRIFNHRTFDGFARRGKSTRGGPMASSSLSLAMKKGRYSVSASPPAIPMTATRGLLKCSRKSFSANFMATRVMFPKTCLRCSSTKAYTLSPA